MSFSMFSSGSSNRPTRAGSGDARSFPFQRHRVHPNESTHFDQPRPRANGPSTEATFRNESGSLSSGRDRLPAGRNAEIPFGATSGVDPQIRQPVRRSASGYAETSESESRLDIGTDIVQSIQNGEHWVKDFIKGRDTIIDTRHNKDVERIKITIIDTGLDRTHPFIVRRQWQEFRQTGNKSVALFKDFTTENPSAEAIDDEGHGTFIAGIVLQLAPFVELSIARVGITQVSLMDDPYAEEKVTAAINHAIDVWDADIISTSIALPRIKTSAFREAVSRATWKNKIICASGGNFGGSRANVAFPARLLGVFKIFASDHHGNNCAFTPRPGLDADFCFSILGQDVVSIWPEALYRKDTGLTVVDKRSSKKHPGLWVAMSGSSYATPIVASIVALLYHFYDANYFEMDLGPGLEFKTIEAIRAILLKMSMAPSVGQHNYLNPWVGRDNYFNFRGEEDGVAFFAQMLRHCLNAWNK
ncbi:thermostable alkaline protease [Colletotrichum melonis]|uniref:Thermostable alkaline protease n=1 Tax=Colletotrichum melonis TaxID=1209925 RepID=A0AAI9XH15_9PEZI|nr:thermostable alkaline protease [Colletotrichum melonis]